MQAKFILLALCVCFSVATEWHYELQAINMPDKADEESKVEI